METKVCTKCGEKKELGDFYKNKNCKDGLAYQCKKCQKSSQIQRRLNDYTRVRALERLSEKRFYKRNRKHCIRRASAYTEKHPDRRKKALIRANFKAWNGFPLPEDIVEIKYLINKINRLCKTSTN